MSVSRKNATKRDRQQSLLDLALANDGCVKPSSKVGLGPSSEIIREIILEEGANRHFTETDKNRTEKYRKYYDAKIVAMKLEQVNDSKLILFPSVGEGEVGEWYKMGGNSALFYKNIVGPRMGRKNIQIRRDADMNHRFRDGVVAVHWKQKFMEKMIKIGCEKFEENELGMLFFDLGMKYSKSEIEMYRDAEKLERDKLGQIIVPKNNYPDLYGIFLQLAKLVPPKVKRMHPAYREMFQKDLTVNLIMISKNYTKMANGDIDKKTALKNILDAVDNLLAVLAVVAENGLFGVAECARIGEILADLRAVTKRRLKDSNG